MTGKLIYKTEDTQSYKTQKNAYAKPTFKHKHKFHRPQ